MRLEGGVEGERTASASFSDGADIVYVVVEGGREEVRVGRRRAFGRDGCVGAGRRVEFEGRCGVWLLGLTSLARGVGVGGCGLVSLLLTVVERPGAPADCAS